MASADACGARKADASGLDYSPFGRYVLTMYTPLAKYLPVVSPYGDEDTDPVRAMKRIFAAALLRWNDDPFSAARSVEPNSNKAAHIVRHWVDDPIVVAEVQTILIEQGPIAMLPQKEEFAIKVLRLADAITMKDTKLDYLKLFADVMGFNPKGGGINVNNTNVNSATAMVQAVFEVPAPETAEQWQLKTVQHQERLVAEAAEILPLDEDADTIAA